MPSETIQDIYIGSRGYTHMFNTPGSTSITKHMIIPITDDVFEVPMFCKDTVSEYTSGDIKRFVCILRCEGYTATFRSFEPNIRNVLFYNTFRSYRLIKMNVKGTGRTVPYFGTLGAIFDANMKPLLTCSWAVKIENNILKNIKPIARISSECFTDKTDEMKRYLSGKFIVSLCNATIRQWQGNNAVNTKVDIRIDDSPFDMREVSMPNILTTNESLLNLVISHPDEIRFRV